MSFKYSTKTIEELQSITKVICDNFAELIGCEEDSKLWSPPTAGLVCSSLILAGSNCSNVSNQREDCGILSYQFTSTANSYMKDIWNKVLNYDTSIFNMNKMTSVKINSRLSIENRLKVCINQSREYDSFIIEALNQNKELVFTDDYRRIMWIVLACFSIRYTVYDFAIGISSAIDLETLNESFINRVIENIKYEKYMLTKQDNLHNVYEISPDYISQQLSLLLKNCKQLQAYVISYLEQGV